MESAEIIHGAEVRARALERPRDPDAELERLRAESLAFCDELPEPPIYRRADDPARAAARRAIPHGQELLARCLALSATREGRAGAEALLPLLRAALELECDVAEGRTESTEAAFRRVKELREAAATARRAWARSDEARPPVFDKPRGVSRYDPAEEATLRAMLACPWPGCHQSASYSVAVAHAAHELDCERCGRTFAAYFAETVELARSATRSRVRYTFRLKELGGGATRLEMDDASRGELLAARGDLLAFLYAPSRQLRGVLNLSTSRVLWLERGSACFVATVAFGAEAPELLAFRAYRDEVLMRSAPGRALVGAYYLAGPIAARALERSLRAKALVRLLLSLLHRRLERRVR